MIGDLVAEGEQYDRCIAIGPIRHDENLPVDHRNANILQLSTPDDHGRRYRYVRRLSCCRRREIKFACVNGPEFDGHLIGFNVAMKRQAMYKTEEGQALLKLREAIPITVDVEIAEVTNNGRRIKRFL